MRIRFKQIAFAAAALAFIGAVCLAYAYFIEPHRLVVNAHEIARPWPKEFDGLRIVLISDLHAGTNGVDHDKLRRIVETANAQMPDLIVLLGDHVAETRRRDASGRHILMMPMEQIAEGVKGLQAKHGVFAILGNHDELYSGSDVEQELERVGIPVLDGELRVVTINGRPLRILGLKDHLTMTYWEPYASNARQLLRDTEGTGPVLILQHSSEVAGAITGPLSITDDPVLMLSGHSHGGQIWLPIIGAPIIPSSYGQKHTRGLINEGGMDVFITTGIGTSLLPFRFMVPPEIVVLTIKTN